MPDSFMVIGPSDATRFWSKEAADRAAGFLNRQFNREATLIDDPTPARPVAPPTNTVPPSIQTMSNLNVGAVVVIASHGTWTGNPANTRQWMSSGVAISGATAPSYVLQDSDGGNMITCRVTATNAGGSAVAVSNALGPVIPVRR